MSPRTGRPILGDSPREIKLQIRVSKEELALLNKCAQQLGTTKTDVLIQGIKLIKQVLDANKK